MSNEAKIKQFFSTYPERRYTKGQSIIFAGDDPKYIFYVSSGVVREYDISYRGDEVVVNLFKTPAFFPMSWAVNKTPNRFFFKAETDAVLHIAPPEEVVNFIKANPDIMFDLLGRVYRGIEGLLGRQVHLMAGTAKSRLVYELLIEMRRFGQPQADGEFLLGINENDLAARAGMSRETISRELKKLKDAGWVSVGSFGIKIKNPENIAKLLEN